MADAAPTLTDLFNDGKSEVISRRPEITVDEGDVSEMLLFGSAAMADHVVAYAVGRFKATFLDGAEGDDLTTLADDHWNVQRKIAIEATGEVTFSRATSDNGAGTILAGTVVETETGVQFITDSDVAYGATETGDKTVTVTAILTGPGGNVDPGTITKITSDVFDSNITVTNSARMAGGADEESDDDLRARVRARPSTLQRGTLAALEFAAINVPGISLATATDDESTGLVSVYVSDSNGGSSPAMVTKAQAAVKSYKCAGSIVNVVGAALVTITGIVVDLTVRAGVDKAALADAVKAAIVARLNKLRIGESATQAQFLQAVLNVDEGITDATVTVTIPALNPFDLMRTTTANITVNTN